MGKTKAIATIREPTSRERAAIAEATTRQTKRGRPVSVKVSKGPDGQDHIDPPHSDRDGWSFQQFEAFGTGSPAFMTAEVLRLVNVLSPHAVDEGKLNAALAVMEGIQPKNEVEAMLAVQMAATHSLTMEMMRIAAKSDLVPQIEMSGNLAIKLARTFTTQVEALAKLRRGGEQKVTVEHVHVHAGGRAVVGNVTHSGGGVSVENEGQYHAAEPRTVAFAPGTPMWSEDEERDAVPVAQGQR